MTTNQKKKPDRNNRILKNYLKYEKQTSKSKYLKIIYIITNNKIED